MPLGFIILHTTRKGLEKKDTFFLDFMSRFYHQNISLIMKKIVFLISIIFMGLATFAQTIIIDNDYAKDGTVLRFKDNKYSKGVYLYDSTLGTDSICGIAACVCNIDKRGNS